MLKAIRYFFRRLFQPLRSKQYFEGIHCYNSGDYEEAARSFALIREGVYKTSVLYRRLSDFYYYRSLRNAAILAFYRGESILCIQHCQEALDIVSDDLICRNYLAHSFHRVGQNGAAIMQLEAMRTKHTEREEVVFKLAKLKILAGRLNQAIKIIEELIESGLPFADFYNILGIAYSMAGHPEQAKQAFRQAIEQARDFFLPRMLLGIEELLSGNRDDARRYLSEALEQAADNPDLIYFLSIANSERALPAVEDLREKLRQIQKGLLGIDISYGEHFGFLDPIYDKPCVYNLIELFESLTSTNPRFADYHYKLGTFYIKAGEPEMAIKALKEALEINPFYIDALDSLSHVYESEGRLIEALEITDQILAQLPLYPKQLMKWGRLCIKLGRFEDAARAMIAAFKGDSRYSYNLYLAGQIFKDRGHLELAAQSWDEIREFMPRVDRQLKRLQRQIQKAQASSN